MDLLRPRFKLELPTEIWCHILSFVTTPNEVISCKRVSTLFYRESSKRSLLSCIIEAVWNQINLFEIGSDLCLDVVSHFTKRSKSPRATQEQIKRIALIRKEQNLDVRLNGEEYAFIASVFALGPRKVGVSMLKRTLQYGCFNNYDTSTDFVRKIIKNADGVSICLQVWDMSIYTKFKGLVRSYSRQLRDAKVLLLCFAIEDRTTFVKLIEETLAFCVEHCPDGVEYYLVGLKADLHQHRQVSVDEAQMVAHELRMKYFEVSCKDYPQKGNLNEMLQEIGEEVLATMTYKHLPVEEQNTNTNSQRRWCLVQ